MGRAGLVTMKGNAITLEGDDLAVGSPAPRFTLHGAGFKPVTLEDLKGKPSIISIVPSLDTPVCATQTKTFNQELASLGDKVNAVTVSRDLPFAQARFCGAEDVNMQTASDYQTHDFGRDWGVGIEENKLLTRAVIVLDADGKVAYKEIVAEVATEPDYNAAMAALRMLV